MSLGPLSIKLLDWCGRIMKSNSKRNPTLRFYLQLFLFIDPGWDIHQKMTSGLFSLDKIKGLPEYPYSHPSKSRSQNKMPLGEWWLNTCGHGLHVLDCFSLQSFYLNLIFCLSSLRALLCLSSSPT